jgi:HD superfamily phosphohydrolase YqeK
MFLIVDTKMLKCMSRLLEIERLEHLRAVANLALLAQ